MKYAKTTADREWPIKLNTQYLPDIIKGLNLYRGTHIQHPSPLIDTGLNDFLGDWLFGQHLCLSHGLTFHKELLSAGWSVKEQAVDPL